MNTDQISSNQNLNGDVKTSEEGTEPEELIRVDLHCHTEISYDSITPLGAVPQRCLERGIIVQAITDHNDIRGAQELKKQLAESDSPLNIIIGEEISTQEGELIGLFLEETVEADQTPEATVAKIREQGGLVLLPHGFDPLKRWRLRPSARERIASEIDIVEGFNARTSRRRWNAAAVEWANSMKVPVSAGSDAHTLHDIGAAWVEVPKQPIYTPEDLLRALDGKDATGLWTHPVIAYLLKTWYRLRARVKGV